MATEVPTMVLATANAHKVDEMRALLADVVDLVPRPLQVGDVVEDADTFVGNARLKAVALRDATGMAAIADDSGLVVDALGGAPGVHSARYAGDGATDSDNVAKLLGQLAGVAPAERTARFRTVVLVSWPDGSETVAEGVIEGHIVDTPRGESGFGYDPVFVPMNGDGRTFAELTPAEKNADSHRSRAVAELVKLLRSAH